MAATREIDVAKRVTMAVIVKCILNVVVCGICLIALKFRSRR